MSTEYCLRPATVEDAEALRNIYAHYILNTAVTFEMEVPSVEEFAGRIVGTLKKYPYLVATKIDGSIVGYAYAVALKGRRALDCSVEASIYLNAAVHGQGVGRRLYQALEQELKAMRVTNVYVSIAYAEQEDEYLTHGSVRFHERMGYTLCGDFHHCAVKFGRPYDLLWMEKFL